MSISCKRQEGSDDGFVALACYNLNKLLTTPTELEGLASCQKKERAASRGEKERGGTSRPDNSIPPKILLPEPEQMARACVFGEEQGIESMLWMMLSGTFRNNR